jgi:prevent-host-death family protein
MSMGKKATRVPAGEFKSRCLALLDEVAATGREIVVTKRGRPVARVLPPEGAEPASLVGSVRFHGDLVAPFHEDWGEGGGENA